jgi:hypothetical protein
MSQAMSAPGTFETCRGTLRMSVLRGRPEVIGARSERRFCPIATEHHSGAKCEDDHGQVRSIREPLPRGMLTGARV